MCEGRTAIVVYLLLALIGVGVGTGCGVPKNDCLTENPKNCDREYCGCAQEAPPPCIPSDVVALRDVCEANASAIPEGAISVVESRLTRPFADVVDADLDHQARLLSEKLQSAGLTDAAAAQTNFSLGNLHGERARRNIRDGDASDPSAINGDLAKELQHYGDALQVSPAGAFREELLFTYWLRNEQYLRRVDLHCELC